MAIQDAQITIMVREMDRSILFYQFISFTLQNRWADHYAQLTAPGIVIGLHPTGNNSHSAGSGNMSIGFTTDNFKKAANLLISLSVPAISRDEEGGKFLHFNDPDETALYFIKPKW